MNKLLPLALLLAFALVPARLRAADNADPVAAAVLDFQAAETMPANTGKDVAVLLSAKLSASPSLLLVERQEIDKMLGEHELGASGAEKSPDKIGQLIGAQVLITGRVFGAGQANYIAVKVMSVETGRVFGEVANFKDSADLPNAVDQLAGKIDDILAKRASDLLAKPDTLDASFAKLKASLAGKKLPSITVSIPEQHIGAPTVDPAAQTEMLHRFQELGFPVVNPASGIEKADVVITGEAFSEFGLRKGSLIACKARVEVKAVRRADGALLFTDAQRGVAFDLGEASTGKLALEKTAAQLLLKIVPALTR
ncbi:MAG TPA: CsgG/HfaB family protein [Candidatus Methylacidiphilales bacterium]